MEIFSRGLRFIRRYALTNLKYTCVYLMAFWRNGFSLRAHFLSEEEFIKEIERGKSLIRLGDGEINLMLGLRNYYQNFSPILKNDMYKIVNQYDLNSPYILAIPKFINYRNSELKGIGKLYVWLPFKIMFWLYFNKKTSYLDAHSFYYDEYFERTVGPAVLNKHVVLITKQETIDKQKDNLNIPWSRVSYVPTPKDEALSSYENIKEKIEATIKSIETSDIVLLFALGPVGKQLAFEYAKREVQSIDIGKVAEVMYTGESIAYII
jgi:hypothetical protein